MRIEWDKTAEKLYETGIDRTVLYRPNTEGKFVGGVPWNGVTGITESPSGAEPTDLWADNIKYLSIMSAETLGVTISTTTPRST